MHYDNLIINVTNPNSASINGNSSTIFSHILTFSEEVGCVPAVDKSIVWQKISPTLYAKKDDPIKTINDYCSRHNIDAILPYDQVPEYKWEYATPKIQKYVNSSFDIFDTDYQNTMLNHMLPGFMDYSLSQHLFPKSKCFYVEHKKYPFLELASYLLDNYPSLKYEVRHDTHIFLFDKFINRDLPDNNIIWLSASDNHIKCIAQHMIRTLDYSIDTDELCDILINIPLYFIRKCYIEKLPVEYLFNYEKYFFQELVNDIKKDSIDRLDFNDTNVVGVDIDRLLYSDDRIDYYEDTITKLGLTPNIKRFENYVARYSNFDNNDIILNYIGEHNIFYKLIKAYKISSVINKKS